MNDKDDLSVWNDFIKKEFRVENKDVSLSNSELNDDNRSQIFKKKKKITFTWPINQKNNKKISNEKN